MLFTPQPFNPDYEISQTPGPVLLVSPAAAAAGAGDTGCTTLAASGALAGGLSADRTTLFWLLAPPEESDTQLWTAADDGSGRRLLGTGPILGPPHEPHFVGDSRLQLTLGRDLMWLDVRDDPVHMHYITEQAFGTAIDVGDWLVTGHSYSDQDATGRLSVINRQTGRTLPISPEVDFIHLSGRGAAEIRAVAGRPRRARRVCRARPQPVAAGRPVAGDGRQRGAAMMPARATARLAMLVVAASTALAACEDGTPSCAGSTRASCSRCATRRCASVAPAATQTSPAT